MKIMGIDNGLDGGIVTIDKKTLESYRMPTVKIGKTKRVYDEAAIQSIIQSQNPDLVIIERAQVMHKQGVVSGGKTMYQFGLTVGILRASNIKFQITEPKKWQKEFSISGETKRKSYSVACNLFPEYLHSFKTSRGKILDGVTDALLMAEYGRRLTTRR